MAIVRPHWLFVIGVAACGRIGFTESTGDAGPIDASVSELAPITCPVVRSPIDADTIELVVARGVTTDRLVAWRRSNGEVRLALLDAAGTLGAPVDHFTGELFDRLVGAYVVANGFVLALERGGIEVLYSLSPDLGMLTLRATSRAGGGHDTITSFGPYVMWAHVAESNPNMLLVDRLDADGVPTPHANRSMPRPITDLAFDKGTEDHGHIVWREDDGTCTATEPFGMTPNLDTYFISTGCDEPRGAGGVGDSITTVFRTSTGALRTYGLSPTFDVAFDLSPAGHAPLLGDDETLSWATWFDDRASGALVLAKINYPPAVVEERTLTGVTPIGAAGVALVGEANPATVYVIESGQLAVVRACL